LRVKQARSQGSRGRKLEKNTPKKIVATGLVSN